MPTPPLPRNIARKCEQCGENSLLRHVSDSYSRDPSAQPHDLRRAASVRMTGFECFEKLTWRIAQVNDEFLPQRLKARGSYLFTQA